MDAKEFFGPWYKCINPNELTSVVSKVRPLYQKGVVYPAYKDIFKAFKLCDYNNLKVVIIGMDPYNDGAATGLAFANNPNTDKVSPSLQVIKDCLERNYMPRRQSFDLSLESWERQGVLLLNSSLTVDRFSVGSHSMIWRKFVASFLQGLGKWQTGIIYVLLGEQAKTLKPYITRFNDVIECKHPAYYARTHTVMPNIFEQIDALTWSKNKFKIIWI